MLPASEEGAGATCSVPIAGGMGALREWKYLGAKTETQRAHGNARCNDTRASGTYASAYTEHACVRSASSSVWHPAPCTLHTVWPLGSNHPARCISKCEVQTRVAPAALATRRV